LGEVVWSGEAGTLQEIFQDGGRNYYRAARLPFSPRVFFGKDYWAQTLPAESLLEALFKNNNRGQEYKDNVPVTSDENQTIDFIVSPPPKTHLR
jgi:hypothetical protein